jgi:hypothetical protein
VTRSAVVVAAPAELQLNGGIGRPEARRELHDRQRARQDREDIVALCQRPAGRGGRRSERRHAGPDLRHEAVGEPASIVAGVIWAAWSPATAFLVVAALSVAALVAMPLAAAQGQRPGAGNLDNIERD